MPLRDAVCSYAARRQHHGCDGPTSPLHLAGTICLFVFWIITFLCLVMLRLKDLVHIKLVVLAVSAIPVVAQMITLTDEVGEVARQPGTAKASENAGRTCRLLILAPENYVNFETNAA